MQHNLITPELVSLREHFLAQGRSHVLLDLHLSKCHRIMMWSVPTLWQCGHSVFLTNALVPAAIVLAAANLPQRLAASIDIDMLSD